MTSDASLTELVNNLKRLSEGQRPTGERPATGGVDPSRVVDELMEALRAYAGFRTSPRLRSKLEHVLRKAPEEELLRWRRMLGARDVDDPLTALVEDLTNHETYFFRDQPQLDALAHRVLPEAIQRNRAAGRKSLKIWCAAVSTGEEAYTLAILALEALRAANESDWDIEVIGTDISRQAIRIAREGVYQADGLASFRNLPGRYEPWFEPVSSPGRVASTRFRRPIAIVRDKVRFERFNLNSAKPAVHDADLVLCRNVLIYLEPPLHGRIQAMLCDALRPGGHLMMSPVDRLNVPERVQPRWIDRTVVYEKR